MIGGPLCIKSMGYCLCCDRVDVDDLTGVLGNHVLPLGLKAFVSPSDDFSFYTSEYTDNRNFIDYGVPNVFLTNVAGMESLPDFYHTERDTVEIIDWESFDNGVLVGEMVLKYLNL